MAEQFQFDTSGEVRGVYGMPYAGCKAADVMWPDLSPGAQGCIAEMLQEVNRQLQAATESDFRFGYSHLHPDTLARIIADWERFEREHILGKTLSGEAYWKMRQAGDLHSEFTPCRPVTPYLNDEGKVCLKEQS